MRAKLPICPGCGNVIDRDVCWCGDERGSFHDNHNFVPMGCDCGRSGFSPELRFFCDDKRHLVCTPYSPHNLHSMAETLGIGRHWFHKDHYDIPFSRVREIQAKCTVVTTRQILSIIGRV
jgi:hypothetical protein